jgi:hypothetical protein
MEVSVIQRVNGNLIYIQNPNKKPKQQEYLTSVDFNRAIVDYGRYLKFYEIKKSNEEAIYNFLSVDDKTLLETENGAPIPVDRITTFEEGGKKYAKLNDGKTAVAVKKEETTQETMDKPKVSVPEVSDKFKFEIQVDDNDGEPVLEFFYDGKTDSMEKKILKSFVIKALKNGVEIKSEKNNFYKFKINKK